MIPKNGRFPAKTGGLESLNYWKRELLPWICWGHITETFVHHMQHNKFVFTFGHSKCKSKIKVVNSYSEVQARLRTYTVKFQNYCTCII